MPRVVPAIQSFNAGELSPLMDARDDEDKYFSGCKTLLNFLCTVQGPAVRRGGTRFVSETKNNGKVWFSKFIFNRDQSYILEFGDNYIRFYTNRGLLLDGASPYEVSTPWTYNDLTTDEGTFALHFVQSGDILYIVHTSGTFRPKQLNRFGATNWTLTDFEFRDGPFEAVDPDETITVTPSALTGTGITLTASSAIFNSDHVGSLFYFEIPDYGDYPAWEVAANNLAVGDKLRWQGNFYEATEVGDRTGNVPPTHLEGEAWDGPNENIEGGGSGTAGVKWKYLHSGYGIARITAFTSGTVVTADVVSRLPGDGANTEAAVATTRWAFQDVSDDAGWPTSIDFYKERLSFSKDRLIIQSGVGDYNNFAAKTGFEVLEVNAIRLPIAQKQIDQILWISQNRDLLVGTDAFEFSIGPQTTQKVYAPDNIDSEPHTNYGSRLLQPLEIDNATLHVQSSGQRVRELLYSYEIERYRNEDISVLSEHILRSGVIDWCAQRAIDNVVWTALGNGTMAGMTYNRPRGVVGWHRHIIGGYSDSEKTQNAKVLTCETIPSPSKDRDDVWLCVERYIDGGIKRYVEYIEDYRLLETAQEDGFYVDCGLTYDGAATNTITGLDHLEGETVQVSADGAPHGDRTVESGSITLDFPASKVHVGFGYRSVLTPMRIAFGAQDGSAQSRVKSIADIVVRFKDTIGGKIGIYEDALDAIPSRPVNLPVGQPTPLFTGDRYLNPPSDWNRDGFVHIVQDQAAPMTVIGLYPRTQIND